jgi:hypothetical protein
MKRTVWWGVVAAAALAACSARQDPELEPAPEANAVSGIGEGATTTAAGVRVEARAGAWQWEPRDLQGRLEPLLVHIENTSTTPILLRYNRISLAGSTGQRYAAMPPYDVNGTLTAAYTVRNPYYPFTGFTVAPYLRSYYPLMTPFDGPFAYDPLYYDPYLTAYRRIQLPTADMVQRALPEGVLEPGGKVSGFVYFEHVDEDIPRFDFKFEIVDADSNRPVGTASIPFVNRS